MDDNMSEERETSWELEARLRKERAKLRYLEQHPYHKDKAEIKPMKAVIELAQKHFEDNPEDEEFDIEKGLLASRLGIGSTKTLSICDALAGEYDFITDSRGSIIIDKLGFQAWIKLTEELEKEKEKNINQNQESQALIKEIQAWKGTNETNEKILAESRSTRDKLKNSLDQQEKEKENLPKEIKDLGEKLTAIKKALEKEKKEASDLNDEIQKAIKEKVETEENNRQKITMLEIEQKVIGKRKKMSPIDIAIEERNKLKAELSEIKSHPLYDDYRHEKSIWRKIIIGFLWFLSLRAIEWLITYIKI